ncbi:MAG: DEAD/DEAH box helicase, partial [Micrococcales bacterium]
MTELGAPTGDLSGNAAGEVARHSIWPAVEERVVDLIAPSGPHRSSLVFTNSRRLAERLTARLNEIWEQRWMAADALAGSAGQAPVGQAPSGQAPVGRPPAQMMAAAGQTAGAPPILAKAHHGSVSMQQRALIEDDLKSGRLPAVVATSSVSSGLQRVGRAGHQVGAVSRGVILPKFRGDLVTSAVVTARMRDGQIEALRIPANPLDVLAQQVVAAAAMRDWDVDELFSMCRRATAFGTLSRPVFEAVLDMLAGRYPSEDFAELRPRIVWDRLGNSVSARPGAQRLAVTSGGTIPDRGSFGVFLAGQEPGSPGRRVGELDEEMVYESRVGDLFTLGASTWQIVEITRDQVLVVPAPGAPGRLPFWHGDSVGRPAELGAAVGAFVREVDERDRRGDGTAVQLARDHGLDENAAQNLLRYVADQREATGRVPTDRTLVLEKFRDELGDWRVVLHSPYGAQVHAAWALAVAARITERFGVDAQVMGSDDGIVARLPDTA